MKGQGAEVQEVRFDDGRVYRKFAPEWAAGGIVNLDKLPELIGSVMSERRNMVEYIAALHETIDRMMRKNNICDVAGCLTANCGSDHK